MQAGQAADGLPALFRVAAFAFCCFLLTERNLHVCFLYSCGALLFRHRATLAFEVRRLGAENVQVTDGRVQFSGPAPLIAAANLNLRTAERVLLLLKTWQATTFDELFDGVYAIPWEEPSPPTRLPGQGSSLSSQLSSVPACQSIVKKAVVKRLMTATIPARCPKTGPEYKLALCAAHKYRRDECSTPPRRFAQARLPASHATLAPIKETLAAAIADLGRVRRDTLVQDPFLRFGHACH